MAKGGRFFSSFGSRPIAAIYRGEVASEGCAESLAEFLKKSPMRYKVHFLGPKEDHDINFANLSHLDLFAWPGGGDEAKEDFEKVKQYKKPIQEYVHNGGKYLGVCLGAYFARCEGENEGEEDEFFGLLPKGTFANCERFEKGSQIKSDEDSIIYTDWNFGSGSKKGQIVKNRYQYFQDGAQFHLGPNMKNVKVLGRYSYTQDPSAIIFPYGKGSVGLIGFHPEADQEWYDDEELVNPQGVSFELGYDFIQTLFEAQGKGFSV